MRFTIHDTQRNTYEAKNLKKKAIVDSILSYLYLEKYLKRQIKRVRTRARVKEETRARKKSSLQVAYPIVNRL